MGVVHPAFFVPPDIELRLATGELVRYGGVIRDTAGRLVMHLREISPDEAIAEGAVAAVQSALRSRKLVGSVLVGAAMAAATAAVWAGRRKRRQRAVPECVTRWNESLRAYLRSLEEQSLDVDLVDSVIASLDELRGYAGEGTLAIDLTAGQFVSLLELVIDYTEQLGELNAMAPPPRSSLVPGGDSSTVAEIRRHLEVQRTILSEAA